jgi:allophanate hydrolase
MTGVDHEATTLLVVAGAHLRGEPLHPALLALGARFVRATKTAPEYRMVALPALDGVPPRPGLVRDPAGGGALEVEIYELPVAALGRLLLTVAPPLAIGTVVLADGSAAPGFVCEGYAAGAVPDISAYGGWRGYLAAATRTD